MTLHENQSIRILLIEDEKAFALALTAVLERKKRQPFVLESADWLFKGIERLARGGVDLVLLDLTLPDSQGIETLLQIRKQSSLTPVIVLTGRDDDIASEALKMGAQDYLLKGSLDGDLLWRSIRYAIERAHLIEQRDEFMAALTHDLKNPLIGSGRVLQLLADGTLGAVSDQQSAVLQKLAQTNDHLLSMVHNLLDVYRLEKDIHALALAHTNLVNIVSACIEQMRPLALQKNLALESNLNAISVPLLADHERITRVVHNLLDNAIKFTPQGGKVKVRLFEQPPDVIIEVADTGPGINVEDERLLFEKFGRGASGRNYRGGTGLGLFVCKQIVEKHGGQISCRSDNGAVFTVQLPYNSLTPSGATA